MDMVSDLRRMCGTEFSILSGDDSLTLPIMALGGNGVICVASNLVPASMSTMVNILGSGDFQRGRPLYYELLPLFRALALETNPIPVKAAACLSGLCSDEVRLPLTAMEGDNLRLLRNVLDRMDLIKLGVEFIEQ